MTEHKFEFVQREVEDVEYTCPHCGGKLQNNGRVIACDGCEFKLWLTAGGKTLTEGQIKSFFDKGTTGLIKGFKSKAGKKFDAEIVLNDEKTGTKYKFPDRK